MSDFQQWYGADLSGPRLGGIHASGTWQAHARGTAAAHSTRYGVALARQSGGRFDGCLPRNGVQMAEALATRRPAGIGRSVQPPPSLAARPSSPRRAAHSDVAASSQTGTASARAHGRAPAVDDLCRAPAPWNVAP